MPLPFSVVIATKDRVDFLECAIESLIAQTDAPPFDVIVVDNGSSDGTAALIEAYHQRELPFLLTRLFVPEPNRAKARNAGITIARGEVVVFVDDDVWLPERFLAEHATIHAREEGAACVAGPILNVASYDDRPQPTVANYSRAFLCTCNASVSRTALVAVGGFDERFTLYGWEDTDLGLRLRRTGVRRRFAWDAYLYHIKPPTTETLETLLRKNVEKARMAARFLEKDGGLRARLATGAYAPNMLRGQLLAPEWALPFYAGIAQDDRMPGMLRCFARAQLLDGAYVGELRRAMNERALP